MAQGVENAGKVLGINTDGMVVPITKGGINYLNNKIILNSSDGSSSSSQQSNQLAGKFEIALRDLNGEPVIFNKFTYTSSESKYLPRRLFHVRPIVINFLNGLILPDGNYTLSVGIYRSIAGVFGPVSISITISNGELITPYETTEINFPIDTSMTNLNSFDLIIIDLTVNN